MKAFFWIDTVDIIYVFSVLIFWYDKGNTLFNNMQVIVKHFLSNNLKLYLCCLSKYTLNNWMLNT